MSTFKTIIATLLVAFAFESGNLFANPDNTKIYAVKKVLFTAKVSQKDGSFLKGLLKIVNFKNSIPELLKLKEEFANPQYLDLFLKHFDFMINDQAIPVNESRTIMVRTDKPFTFSIKAKRGKIESLLALIKTSTQNLVDQLCVKAANLLTFCIKYDCPFHDDYSHHDEVMMDELVYHHPDMREALSNPKNMLSRFKPYMTWSEWFGFEVKLPELKMENPF